MKTETAGGRKLQGSDDIDDNDENDELCCH